MAKAEHITLKVEGMDCSNCALAITKNLQKKGLADVYVDFATGEASFLLDNRSELPSVVAVIEKTGYRVSDYPKEKKEIFPFFHSIENKFYFCLIFTIPLLLHMLSIPFLQQAMVQLVLCLPVFILGIIHFGRSAFNSVKAGAPNMDVLIFIGAASAFFYSLAGTLLSQSVHETHQYLFYETSASIITLVLLGNLLEHRSVKQTTTAIQELTALQQVKARRIVSHGSHEHIEEVDYQQLRTGDILLVNEGDNVPVDGTIIAGAASIDESMISGESLPVDKNTGEKVIGGTLLRSGNLRIKADKVGNDTVLAQIIRLVKDAQKAKPDIQKIGDRISAVFVPVVLGISLVTFFISYGVLNISIKDALMRSVAVLVISCPCAMGLATPTAVMVGIGRAAKKGVLIKGGATLELLAGIKTILFDKTGTLTTGKFMIKQFTCNEGVNETEIKNALYTLELHSSHPIAQSLVSELKSGGVNGLSDMIEVTEQRGTGMIGKDSKGNTWKAGSSKFLTQPIADTSHNVYVLKNDRLVATVDMEDAPQPFIKETMHRLTDNGMKLVMVSGDQQKKCEEFAAKVGITTIHSEQLPSQKIAIVNHYASENPTAMVGDGINDAPALAAATVGISLGNASQVAIQSAQVILLKGNDPSLLEEAFNISRHTLITIKQNLFWAFFYNIIAIPIAAMGYLSPIIGTMAMALSDVIVIGNSIRLKTKKIS